MADCETKTTESDPFKDVTDQSCCAEEFLEKLDYSQDRWYEGDPWIFRGQNNATWELIPSLYRVWNANANIPLNYEYHLIDNFIRNANLINLDIPSNTLNYTTYFRKGRNLTMRYLPDSVPGDQYRYDYTHVAFAIAQHSGIPTRLLDFTYNPIVAAYFAADIAALADTVDLSHKYLAECFEEIAQIYLGSPSEAVDALRCHVRKYIADIDGLPDEMAVWAIRVNALHEKTTLGMINHPHTEILNLRAQEGAFVFHKDPVDLDVDVRRERFWPSFSDQLLGLKSTDDIRKLTLPHSERHKLFSLLVRKRMGTMYLKPSYEDVASVAKLTVDKLYGLL